MQSFGNQLECDGAIGQRGRFVDELFAFGILDPELAMIGADAVDRAFEDLCALAVTGFIHCELDGGGTAIQNQNGKDDMKTFPRAVWAGAEALLCC